MTKAEQIRINNEVKEVYNDLIACIDHFGYKKVGRLRSCNAVVYKTHGYTYLESYGTKIACMGDTDSITYDFLRYTHGYTATSAQHISKFCRDYYSFAKKTYRPI